MRELETDEVSKGPHKVIILENLSKIVFLARWSLINWKRIQNFADVTLGPILTMAVPIKVILPPESHNSTHKEKHWCYHCHYQYETPIAHMVVKEWILPLIFQSDQVDKSKADWKHDPVKN